MASLTREQYRSIIKKNLQELCKVKGLTQTQLGEILDVNGKSTVSNYLNDDMENVPDVISLLKLQDKYAIPLDVLLSPDFDPKNSFELDGVSVDEYDKFLGVYSLYYLTTNQISGRPNYEAYRLEPEMSYGVLAIVKCANEGITSNQSYKVFACFSLKTIEDLLELKQKAEDAYKAIKDNDITKIRNVFASRIRYCEGTFEFVQSGANYAITLTGFSRRNISDQHNVITDKVMLLGFNPSQPEPKPYIGGGMLCTSISRGLDKVPCSQIILVSKKDIPDEQQEIMNYLQASRHMIPESHHIEEIVTRIKDINGKDVYSDSDKDILLKNLVEKSIENQINNATSQLLYLLKTEDQSFYKFLKNTNSNR